MKKTKGKKSDRIFILVSALCVALLIGCVPITSDGNKRSGAESNGASEEEKIPQEEEGTSQQEIEITGKVIRVDENSILFLQDGEESGGLADFDTSAPLFYDKHGKKIEREALRPGMRIRLSAAANGTYMERYPLGITGVQKVCVLEQQNDMIGLYLDILKEIYDTDAALNDDISTVALDLTEAENLTEQEKESIRFLLWLQLTKEQTHLADSAIKPLNVILSTWEELTQEGLIDVENLYFPEGVLITMKAGETKNNSFRFDVEKWRSGLGAIGYESCKGTFKDGAGTYRLGDAWIS